MFYILELVTDSFGKFPKIEAKEDTPERVKERPEVPRPHPRKKPTNVYDKSHEKLCLALCNIFCEPYVFKKVRPKWLKNPETGRSLEIDIFCEELNIGCEFNSALHYYYDKHIHKTEEAFHKMLERDRLKARLCVERGVDLIIIPFWIPEEALPALLKERLAKAMKRLRGPR